ncbi:MAG: glycerophosphodiester phosphodiesterase [Parabacteroides sp.]
MNTWIKSLSVAGLLLFSSLSMEAQQIIGHRGSVWGVENTRAAFINGVKAGAVGIECDIRNSKDGLFVINHDSSLKRLGASDEPIWEQSANCLLTTPLQQERDGICYVGHVCSLGDYLDLCKELNTVPVIEIKECTNIRSDAKNPANDRFDGVPALMQLIAEKGMTENVVIISFMQSVMDHIWKNYPGVHLQFVTGEDWRPYEQWCKDRRMDIDIYHEKADAELVKRFHEAGLKVNVWTVDDPKDFQRMQEIGVDYITTNKLFPQPLGK